MFVAPRVAVLREEGSSDMHVCILIVACVPVRVAVVREEGSNGDREMAAALLMAGFEVWDVNMMDLKTGSASLDMFRGVVFVGGFSYADVLGSAKGLYHQQLSLLGCLSVVVVL